MKKKRDKERSDSLRGSREAQGSQQGMWRPRVPCADLTALALSQSDSMGLRVRAEVICNDVITESWVCGSFTVQQSTDKPKQHFLT